MMLAASAKIPAVARNIWFVDSITDWTWTRLSSWRRAWSGESPWAVIESSTRCASGRMRERTSRLAVAVLSQAVVMIEVAKAAEVVRRKFCNPAAAAVSSASTELSDRLVVGGEKDGIAKPSKNCG